MFGSRPATLALMALVVVLSGCGKKPAPAPAPVAVAEEPAPRPDDSAAREAAERAAREAEEARRREAARVRSVLEEMVFFDFDQYTVRDDARPILESKVTELRNDPSIRLTVEGHADERGSTEYNLALGNRRAMSVVDYLVNYGIDRSRLRAMTFGEERPLVTGSTESAWARNRRASFVVEGGPTIVAQPPGAR